MSCLSSLRSCRFSRSFSVCGIGWAVTPASFRRATAAAIDVCNRAVSEIHLSKSIDTLRSLDSISNSLCKVLDLAAFIRDNHDQEEWRLEAGVCMQELGAYMYELNAHKPLHDALVAITTCSATMSQLTDEQQVMARLLQAEFERDGIHLPVEMRDKVVRLNAQISDLCALFQQNMREADLARAIPAGSRRQSYTLRHSAYAANCKCSSGECKLISDCVCNACTVRFDLQCPCLRLFERSGITSPIQPDFSHSLT
jgi:Zn-dependent oligopeptidase